jgi:hypothetical protein
MSTNIEPFHRAVTFFSQLAGNMEEDDDPPLMEAE